MHLVVEEGAAARDDEEHGEREQGAEAAHADQDTTGTARDELPCLAEASVTGGSVVSLDAARGRKT